MPVRSLRILAPIVAAFVVSLVDCAKKATVAKTVPPPPPSPAPTATLAASPDLMERGQTVKLTWDTQNANDISIAGIGVVAAKGSMPVVPRSSTTYVLTAKGPGGLKEATARVTVSVPPPTIAHAQPGSEQLFSRNVHDIFFAYDKYSLRPQDEIAVEQDARFLAAHPNDKLLISGHCDERGSQEYNLALGDNRADMVRDQLEKLGIKADRIQTISYGKEKPFCTEETAACWQMNRRAGFSLQP
jgi:peptidoglycan-associated lipoprotein